MSALKERRPYWARIAHVIETQHFLTNLQIDYAKFAKKDFDDDFDFVL